MDSADTIPTLDRFAPLLPLLLLPLTQLVCAWSKAQVVQAFGWWGVPLTTGWIGVPIHELSHVLAARLLGRSVVRVHWFAPDQATGSLGAVEWRPGTGPIAWLALLIVGLAPLFGGSLGLRALLYGAASALELPLPEPPVGADWQAWRQAMAALAEWAATATLVVWKRPGLTAWLAVAGWWAVVSVATHLSPSRSDLRGAWRGGLLVAGPLALTLAGCQLAGIEWKSIGMRAAVGLAWLLAPGLLVAIPAALALGAVATVLGWVRSRLVVRPAS